MGWSNGSADALILGILSSCAAKCRLCARTPRKWGDVVLLQTSWCPLWVGVRCGAWSVQGLVCPAGELSYPEAWCLSAKVALLHASFPALFWGKWKERRKGAKFCVLIGPNLVSCSVPSGTPNHRYLFLGESSCLQQRVFVCLFVLDAMLYLKS